MGGAAEHAAGKGGGEAVHAQGAGYLLIRDIPAQAAGAGGGGVADGFHGGDDEHKAEGQDGAHLELGGIGEQLGYGHHAQLPDGLGHAGKVHHAEAHGHHIAHDHAQQDIQLLGHALEGGMENQRRRQGDGRHQQVLPGAQGILGGGAEGGNAHVENAQADGHHHARGQDGRDDFAPILGRQAQNAFKDTAHNDGPHHNAVILGGGGHAGGQERKAQAHDNGQAGADLPHGIKLEHGADTGDEHAVLQQPGGFDNAEGLAVVHRHRGDDDQRRDVGHKHGQHVLEAEGDCLCHRHAPFQLIDILNAGFLTIFFHGLSFSLL